MATASVKVRGENLTMLHMAYDALTKASDASLRAAFNFGQIIDALANLYTYGVMAGEIGRSPSTVAMYARLYRKFGRVELLLDEAHKAGTYNVAVLAGGLGTFRYQVLYHCLSCGSDDISRERRRLT